MGDSSRRRIPEATVARLPLYYRALLETAMETARNEGATHMELGTSEDDRAARSLYESAGFTNREGKPDGPVMLFYEREL